MQKVAIALMLSAAIAGPALSAPKVTPSVPQLVDATGAFVGTLLGPGYVMINLNGNNVGVGLTRAGFLSMGPSYYYTTPDCTGTRYYDATGLPVGGWTLTNNPQGYSPIATITYPLPPYIERSMLSAGTGPTDCFDASGNTFLSGLVSAPASLNFVAPFNVK